MEEFPMIYQSKDLEQEAALRVAGLMAAAARTAPKGKGVDHLETLVLNGEEKAALAAAMRKFGEEKNFAFFLRDAGNVEAANAVLLLGTRVKPMGLNCGFCGFDTCAACAKAGAVCIFNPGDLGIAVGSAASVAMDHRIDSRVFYSAGKAALEMHLFPADVSIAFGIVLSGTGKSPFFDRPSKK